MIGKRSRQVGHVFYGGDLFMFCSKLLYSASYGRKITSKHVAVNVKIVLRLYLHRVYACGIKREENVNCDV